VCLPADNGSSKISFPLKNYLNDFDLPYFELNSKREKNDEPTVTLAAVGDIRITRLVTVQNIRESMLNNGKAIIVKWLSTKDIVVGNLEMAFIPQQNTCTANSDTGKPEWATLLSELQLSALNLANNHLQFDAGICGIETSLELLERINIMPVGIGNNFLIIKKNGIKIGMLGYARYTMNSDKLPAKYKIGDFLTDDMFEDVKNYKPLVDHLVVFIHWGEALLEIPNPKEENLAKKLLEAGASLILGTGPHVLQKIDIYDNGVVAYSLGNYLFDEFIVNPHANLLAKQSCILEVKFSKSSIERVHIFPILSSSGLVNIPTIKEVSAYGNHLEGLYRFTESDFYDRYELWKRISDRLRMIWDDLRRSPSEAFNKNIKFSYFKRTFSFLFKKYKHILLIIGGIVIVCGFLFFKLRRKHA
jgi:poly-gamma-glutamate synthesis protein (capsule biosynthesis protein)